MGKEVGGRFKREGIYVYLWLIHVDVCQKPTQYCKAIILQLNKLKKKEIYCKGLLTSDICRFHLLLSFRLFIEKLVIISQKLPDNQLFKIPEVSRARLDERKSKTSLNPTQKYHLAVNYMHNHNLIFSVVSWLIVLFPL